MFAFFIQSIEDIECYDNEYQFGTLNSLWRMQISRSVNNKRTWAPNIVNTLQFSISIESTNKVLLKNFKFQDNFDSCFLFTLLPIKHFWINRHYASRKPTRVTKKDVVHIDALHSMIQCWGSITFDDISICNISVSNIINNMHQHYNIIVCTHAI